MTKKILSILLSFIFIFSLSACVNNNINTSQDDENHISSTETNIEDITSKQETDNSDNVDLFETGEILTYTNTKDTTDTSNIKIEYPIFDFESEDINDSIVNDAITRSLGIILEVTDANNSTSNNKELEGFIGFEIQIATKKMVSITFNGTISGKDFAYPPNVFFALNIDPQTGMLIKKDDIVNATPEKLFFLLTEHKGFFASNLHEEYFLSIPKEELIGYLDKIDAYNNNLLSDKSSFYFTDSGICIVLPILHSMGDFSKINIPYTNF